MINYNGLTEEEVLVNRKKYGSNTLTKIKQKSFLKIFIESLGNPIIKILLIALAIKLLFIFSKYDWYETIGIAVAVFLASFISTISEYGSESAFKSLQNEVNKIKVKVVRDGILKEVDIDDIVKNDIVSLSSGDSIPADGILLSGSVTCNESALTGEAKEVYKNGQDKLFRGTTIINGLGKMQVLEVGNNTTYGKIYKEIQSKNPESPLKMRLYGLAKVISKIGYIGALIVSLSYLFNNIVVGNNFDISLIINTLTNTKVILNHLIYALTLAVTIIIVAVPEGLPMMITLVLSSNMKRMMKDNVLVRNPTGIETSGNLNFLLTDKTGTLTKGHLSVSGIILFDNTMYKGENDIKNEKVFTDIYNSIIVNNESIISEDTVIGGNLTDKALITFFKDSKKVNVKKRIPFNSTNKYSAVYLSDYIYLKGASEKIIAKCTKYLTNDGYIKSILNKDILKEKVEKYSSNGYRVLSLAKGSNIDNNLIFIGLVILKDDLRDTTIEAIEEIKDAGINVIMITGDDYNTAKNIAKECKIISRTDDLAITSEHFNMMSDEEVKRNIHKLKVISRSSPMDKSRLVRIIEEMNYVVGMTGDGVNDAPALKKANVGFALGSGTDVAKEASDIIIIDDNIASISKAILYGRTTLKSIRKFIVYQLTVNMTALFLSIVGSFIGISTPITIMQMLWLNMIMDTFAGLAFSYEYPLNYYMKELPKSSNEPIINKYMYSEILFNSIYAFLICLLFLKLPIFEEIIASDFLTSYFALFIFIGIFNAFVARCERLNIFSNILKNKVFIFINIFIIIAQIVLIYCGGSLFRTYGMYVKDLIFVIILALSVIPVDFIRKIILKKKGVKLAF